jgi:signal transduction histidine kinase
VRVASLAVALMAALAISQPERDLRAIATALGQSAAPAFLVLLTAAMLVFNALNVRSLVEWAMDSQRKDARRAELFRQQQEQLRHAMDEIEAANFQLRVLNVQLAEARRVAELANQLKTRFLANVSHELRAPLHVILGLTEAALDTPRLQQEELSPALLRDMRYTKLRFSVQSGYCLPCQPFSEVLHATCHTRCRPPVLGRGTAPP